jgi:hypothetical protein
MAAVPACASCASTTAVVAGACVEAGVCPERLGIAAVRADAPDRSLSTRIRLSPSPTSMALSPLELRISDKVFIFSMFIINNYSSPKINNG